MAHSPDDVPLCSTGGVCIHNYYNSLWEWVNYIKADNPSRIGMNLNTFRSRYADTVAISVLPGIVVMQMLLMGMISLYQVMSHKRSVLLTQIWAYRCQNGRMQVVYLAQITYHIIYNSDLYLLGLGTGTLTKASIMNLTCCIFTFSYAFVNLAKARSGDQQLDRHFRLTWETMQIVITVTVASILIGVESTPLEFITAANGEILRKTSARGAKYCGLNDSCVVYKVNLIVFIALFSIALGIMAAISTMIVKCLSPKMKSAVRSARLSMSGSTRNINKTRGSAVQAADDKPKRVSKEAGDHLTSFERNCIGGPFRNLFQDCDDMAYIMYKDKRCTTVEALLLTGYLYYGEHIYQASSVMMLLISRMIPRKVLQMFNLLLLRWHMDPKDFPTDIIGTVIFMLIVGALVWRWQNQKQAKQTNKLTNPTQTIDDGYMSVWHDPQLLALQLKADDIQDMRKIGGGGYADVWLVKYRGTRLLAAKRLRKEYESRQCTQNFVQEIKLVAKFDHPNIVKLVGAAWTIESDLQALSEYMVGGDLREYLIYPQTPRTWTARKLHIAKDVIEALVYVHSFAPPVVHRDLKSRNVLLSKEMQAKLTDFGVSRIMSEDNTMTQGVGTGRWEAPEVLAGKDDYNQAADIFSFGVVLSELDMHTIPYDDAQGPRNNPLANVAILQMISMGDIRPSFSIHCPPDIRALADRCLVYNPDDRPSAPEVAYALRTATI
ncbi:hypothetical protein JM16_002992 [Phytophthora kernoviae]|uniref:Protein kinase domain-containing protein n=1 Tax=Phytophthora kernoviae TaxID=325452 RepID=A0A8T0M312_9STRA|nr:hypothetical protein JM16_002992 [Phytophthora kernoviae]